MSLLTCAKIADPIMKEVNEMSRKEHFVRIKMDSISLYVDILKMITDGLIWLNLKLVKHTTNMLRRKGDCIRKLKGGDYEGAV